MPGVSPPTDLPLSAFRPIPRVELKATIIKQPRFPVIDAHNHLSFDSWDFDQRPVAELLDILDEAQVRLYVDLDGGWGEDILHHHLDYFKAAAPERFRIYGGVDWAAWPDHGDGFGEWAAQRLRAQAARGAEGLKIWKPFGLHVKDQHGYLVKIDDERLDPVWATAGELGLPVTIHIADPVAFFEPLDPTNERWEELHVHPDWHFPSPPFPSFMALLDAFARLIKRHPQTTFVGAHVGCYAENLQWVGALLDACPNFYVDFSARLGELGRQPYSARRFFIQYADRILFGTDSPPNPEIYRLYYRFLETDDEYFNYGLGDMPRQGRWQIYGLYLPDDVLERIYYKNAEHVLFNGGS
ncbi:MAG: amidohydrolase family protein [Chloroflexi bacterium]|nr:amidohydrolase family protein [Chloroflexota bacterium]